jgi:outer membrane usher protein FimD/PapC
MRCLIIERIALGLPAYKQYTIGLKPEGAPQFDLSGTEKTVTLYPGNVDRIRFQAQRVISIYGQVLNADGNPLARARVEAGGDYAIADDRGYTLPSPHR